MTETVPFDVEPVRVMVNGKWPVFMPPHRAERPEWHTPPYWEGARLDRMFETVQQTSRTWQVETGAGTIAATIDERPTIWDIGAEEGDMPALYATWGADVVLVEPNPKVWPCIRYHWKANNLPNPAGAFVGLVGAEDSVSDLDYYGSGKDWPICALAQDMIPAHGFHHLMDYADTDPVTTLDAMLEHFPTPDIITADIEGGEGHMLAGAETMLADVRPVWFVSVHPAFIRDMYRQIPQEVVFDVFKRHGYTAEHIETRHEAHWVFLP